MTDINELFARDPEKEITDAEIKEIIDYYVTALQRFQLGDKTAGKIKKENGPKLGKTDLEDLLSEIL